MKKIYLILAIQVAFSYSLVAQSIGINNTLPDGSAILDVKSNTKGLLIPRTSTTSRLAITNPAKGLMLYDTTAGSFWYYNGSVWNALSSGSATNYWTANGSNIYNNNSGNVGIGTAAPFAYGHGGTNRIMEISNPNTGINIQSHLILSTNGTSGSIGGITWSSQNVPGTEKRLGFIGDVYETANAARLVFYTRDEAANLGERLTVLGSGNVGIGTTAPADKFTVNTLSNKYGITHTDGTITVGTYVGLGDGWLGTKSNHPLAFFTNNSLPQMLVATNGNVGIGLGISTPLAKLHIAGNIKIDGNNSIELGAGVAGKEANAGKIGYQTFTPDALDIVGAGTTGTNRRIKFWSESAALFNGSVAIGYTNPVAGYKLSVLGNQYIDGLIATTGDAEIGGIAQVSGNLNVGGILNVNGYQSKFFGHINSFGPFTSLTEDDNITELCSIIAKFGVAAGSFIAFSDARIKNVTGISNSAKDLETINTLKITDYTMKDKIMYGNKPFKKVIAQEVEKVYPQVVSTNTGFIPNVYALPSKIEKTANGYLLSFTNNHNLTTTAKKIQVMTERATKQYNIVSIPSDKQVEIKIDNLDQGKLFVYGEEVNDFKAVDYEGLTTLNISATQELSRQLQQQQATIQQQNKRIEELAVMIALLQTKPAIAQKGQ